MILSTKSIAKRVDEAVVAERERCLDVVRYVAAFRGNDLSLIHRLIERGEGR